MRQRTNVYLDQEQLTALKLIALDEHASVADLVRQAVDRLLAEKMGRGSGWSERLGATLGRLRSRLPAEVSPAEVDADVDAALDEVRRERRARRR